MTEKERSALRTIVSKLSSTDADWFQAWEDLCALAGRKSSDYLPTFRERTAEEFMKRALRNYPD